MSNQEDIAIKVEGVYKDFDLPHEAQNSLKTRILHPMSKGKNIEKQHALKDISFEIKKGEFFGIVGRNGSGKSTLLKILAGIYTPTKGKVTVNGSLTPFIELGVGFNPELTGRENVYLNGAMLGFSTKEMEAMYDEIVDFAELEKFMDQKLKNYSSGMQVRLAFSVAIRAKSDILLLDEVLAVGDEAFQRKCFGYFRKLKKDKKTVILVTHDMAAIRAYCDRAVMINEGSVKEKYQPEKVSIAYSRLFSTEEDKSSKGSSNTNEDRYGRQDIFFEKVSITQDENNITLTCELTSKLNDDSLLGIGFMITREDGMDILGFSSELANRRDVKIKARSNKTVKWVIPNVFSDALYYATVSVVDEGKNQQDFWRECATFSVKKRVLSGYPVQPDIKLVD